MIRDYKIDNEGLVTSKFFIILSSLKWKIFHILHKCMDGTQHSNFITLKKLTCRFVLTLDFRHLLFIKVFIYMDDFPQLVLLIIVSPRKRYAKFSQNYVLEDEESGHMTAEAALEEEIQQKKYLQKEICDGSNHARRIL